MAKKKESAAQRRRKEMEACVSAGRSAALALKGEDSCPYKIHDDKVKTHRSAWLYGFHQIADRKAG